MHNYRIPRDLGETTTKTCVPRVRVLMVGVMVEWSWGECNKDIPECNKWYRIYLALLYPARQRCCHLGQQTFSINCTRSFCQPKQEHNLLCKNLVSIVNVVRIDHSISCRVLPKLQLLYLPLSMFSFRDLYFSAHVILGN